MSLVFAGICSHAPGITGRIHMADEDDVRTLQSAMNEMRASLERAKPDALIVIAAEHFANFFMDKAGCLGAVKGCLTTGPTTGNNPVKVTGMGFNVFVDYASARCRFRSRLASIRYSCGQLFLHHGSVPGWLQFCADTETLECL